MEIWESKSPGILWATPGLLQESFICQFVICSFSIVTAVRTHSVLLHMYDGSDVVLRGTDEQNR